MISESLFTLLNELKLNNNRDWFENNKTRYQAEEKSLKKFFTTISDSLNEFDEIEKTKIFRIYKDVRFSKDKTPYKTNRSANWMRAGANRRGSYYLQIEPGNSFLASGFFEPNPQDLLRFRKEFEMDDATIRKIFNQTEFKNVFDGFEASNQVKTAPKGFDKEHKAIDLIKNKNFFVIHYFSDKEVLDSNFLEEVKRLFKLTLPFLNYMTEVVTTDLNGVSTL
jgi:uncharacterized protein (TIGR02453 family)